VASARVALLPSIQLTGDRGYESAILKTLITPQAIAYNVAASVTQPIFDAARLLGLLKLQSAVQQELLEKYRQTIIVALTDVERALIDVRESANQERLARQAVEVARRGYQLSEAQLDAGSIDLTTMLNIQRTLFEAQDNLAQIRLTRFRAIASLYQALGGGWKWDAPPP
jgi:outer membrane protein TolC